MLIIGKETDLYDYQTYVYGVDNKVVFDRRIYADLPTIISHSSNLEEYSARKALSSKLLFESYFINNELYERGWQRDRSKDYEFYDFYYCGRIYVVAFKTTQFSLHRDWKDNSDKGYGKPFDRNKNDYMNVPHFVYENEFSTEPFSIKANDILNAYAEQNNVPYFLYTYQVESNHTKNITNRFIIQKKFLALQDIKWSHDHGFDIDKTYHEVYNFMLSLKNEKNIINVSNDNKITQAGFDLKTSFRGKNK